MTGHCATVIDLELVAFGCRHDQLTYRVVCCPLRPGEPPDEGALRCAGGDVGATTVVHSTSWRFEPPHRLVLTYAIVPDPRLDLPGAAMTLLGVVTSPDPTRPSPPTLHEHHVVAHAVRHLADLRCTDPTIGRAVAAADSPSWCHLLAAASTIRTGSHDDIHNRPAAATLPR